MTMTRILSSGLMFAVTSLLLSGCFVFVDDDDDPPVVNYQPEILSEETSWGCDYSASAGDYFFEFVTVVEDDDGPGDVEYVDVTVYEANTDYEIDSFPLLYEGDAVWGGLVWESESNLYDWCSHPIDVRFEAFDRAGGYDTYTLYYY